MILLRAARDGVAATRLRATLPESPPAGLRSRRVRPFIGTPWIQGKEGCVEGANRLQKRSSAFQYSWDVRASAYEGRDPGKHWGISRAISREPPRTATNSRSEPVGGSIPLGSTMGIRSARPWLAASSAHCPAAMGDQWGANDRGAETRFPHAAASPSRIRPSMKSENSVS